MFLRLRRKKAILGVTFGGSRASARPPSHWSIASDCFELEALHCWQRTGRLSGGSTISN
jgi:hypothetical protein